MKMKLLKLYKKIRNIRACLYTLSIKGNFNYIGDHSLIFPPFYSNDVSEINIGKNCIVNTNGWLECIKEYKGYNYDMARIDIGDRTYIGNRSHIIACSHMKIGKDVVIADNVYITDNFHGYEDVTKPVLSQPLVCSGPVVVSDEVWIGEGVCIMPNVDIGKHSVIGSNSVVTKNIPEYSVAVGSPAKVIKRYDFETERWVCI